MAGGLTAVTCAIWSGQSIVLITIAVTLFMGKKLM